MISPNKQNWLAASLAICLLAIAGLAYYSWSLHSKVEKLETRPAFDFNTPTTQLDDTWPDNTDPWNDNWDPAKQFSMMQKRMDEMMNSMLPGRSLLNHQGFGFAQSSPRVEMEEKRDRYLVTINVPEGQDVEVNTKLSGNTLEISGKVKQTSKQQQSNLFGQSMFTSRFSQSMVLPETVNEAGMKTEHLDDKIVITLPKERVS